MSRMKKSLSLILCGVLLLALLTACANSGGQGQTGSTNTSAESVTVHVGTLKGPTGMGMAGLMQRAEDGETASPYEFTILGTAEDMTAKILSGDVDIAAVPTNVAAVLYNKTEGEVLIAAVNTLGVLYIVDNGNGIERLEDLRGMEIGATGQGAVPEYVLNYLLESAGLDPSTDVSVKYYSEHAELASRMMEGDVTLAMLPQPFVTTVSTKNPDAQPVLDLTQLWDQYSPDSQLTMGCLVVRKEFLDSNRDAVDAFLAEYEQSVAFANTDIEGAAAAMDAYDIIAREVAAKAIPNCNIVFISGEDMEHRVEGFLRVLWEANPQSVGGQMPDEAFYYKG